MIDNELYETIRAMPKVELHRHLEGAIRVETLVDIAREHDFEMPEYTVEMLRPFVQMMPEEPRTMKNFLAKFTVLRQFLLSPEIIRRVTREAVIDAANDNVKYFELRFTPNALCNIIDWSAQDAVACVCETAAETADEYDIQVKLIVSMNRHESLEIGEAATAAAIAHRHMGIVGLDLGGNEVGHSAHVFRNVFNQARRAGLRVTLHAGEWQGAESVWDAIGNVGVDRVGHGIRVLEDEGVVNILVERGIVLEVCPTSNVDTGVVPHLKSHPLPALLERGVKATINTDDPLMFNLTLTEELYRSVDQMGLTLDDLKRQTILAAESAFLPDSERESLVDQFQNWLYPETSPLR